MENLLKSNLEKTIELFNPTILNKIYNLLPIPLILINNNLEIANCNQSALTLLQITDDELRLMKDRRGGTLLHCIHSLTGDGCGFSIDCTRCIIRNSVVKSFSGINTFQEKCDITLSYNQKLQKVNALISVINLDTEYTLLIFENITELINLKQLIPMCSHCKHVKINNQYWESVEEYISNITGYNITHGMCPKCVIKLYPDLPKEFLESISKNY